MSLAEQLLQWRDFQSQDFEKPQRWGNQENFQEVQKVSRLGQTGQRLEKAFGVSKSFKPQLEHPSKQRESDSDQEAVKKRSIGEYLQTGLLWRVLKQRSGGQTSQETLWGWEQRTAAWYSWSLQETQQLFGLEEPDLHLPGDKCTWVLGLLRSVE